MINIRKECLMEPRLNNDRGSATAPLMKRLKYYYLDSDSRRRIDDLLENFLKQGSTLHLMERLKELLPIEKWKPNSLRKHVEGMYYLSERLWTLALDAGKKAYGNDFSRENLLRVTRTLPMSQYRYLTGSREPMNVLLTRDDALQDPSTAFVKLKHDIETWSEFILSARNGTIESAENI